MSPDAFYLLHLHGKRSAVRALSPTLQRKTTELHATLSTKGHAWSIGEALRPSQGQPPVNPCKAKERAENGAERNLI